MNKHLLALSACALLATPVMGADLSRPAYKAASPVAAVYNWSGFYIGAHGGYAWGRTIDTTNPGADQRKPDGGFGGLQAGYNWQGVNSPWVFGVEADVSFGDIKDSWGGANQFDPYYGKDGLKTFGTFRGRIGYAVVPTTLLYVTGGLAWGQNEHGFGCDANRVAVTLGCQNKMPGSSPFYTKNTDTRVGYTVGAGAEIALWDSWSTKIEYAYTDYGTETINMVDPFYPAAQSARNFDGKYHTVKFGLNYRFR